MENAAIEEPWKPPCVGRRTCAQTESPTLDLLVNFKPVGAGESGGVACELDLVFSRRTTPSWRILAIPSDTLPTAFGLNHFIVTNPKKGP
jgi:hypothetical protein